MKPLTTFLIFIVVLLLAANIVSSQNISGLYFRLVDGGKQATVEYLKTIKTLPQFRKDLDRQKALFGQNIENEVFEEEVRRKQRIKELEGLLQKNPKSRDILYALYLLYNEEGNKQIANEYLRKAQEIDPNIGKF